MRAVYMLDVPENNVSAINDSGFSASLNVESSRFAEETDGMGDDVALHTMAAIGGMQAMIETYMDALLRKRNQTPEMLGMKREDLVNQLLLVVGGDQERSWNPNILTANYDVKAIAESVEHELNRLFESLKLMIEETAHLPGDVQFTVRSRVYKLLAQSGGIIAHSSVAVVKFVRECIGSTVIS